MNNILEICQEVADITATQRPTDLFDKNAQHCAIFLSVAKNELDSLMRYGDWQDLTKEASLKTVPYKTVYPIDQIVPDFYALLNNTIYIRDTAERLIGSITPEQWMREKYFDCPDANVRFKIQNNAIKFLTPPPAGVKIVFQYRSDTVCTDAKTGEEKPVLTKNTDIPVFDKYLVKLGITYRLLKRNGMDYTEEYNEYQSELKKKFGTGLSTRDICLGGNCLNDTDVAATGGVCVRGYVPYAGECYRAKD